MLSVAILPRHLRHKWSTNAFYGLVPVVWFKLIGFNQFRNVCEVILGFIENQNSRKQFLSSSLVKYDLTAEK